MVGADEPLNEALNTARSAYHRLVLLIGPSGSGKSCRLRSFAADHNLPLLNVNLSLSQRMLELTKAQRARQVDHLFQEIVASVSSDVAALDNCEILFDQLLQLDPLRLLHTASRSRLVIASWNGTLQNGTLCYAEPQHPEYRSYRNIDAVTVVMDAVTSGS